MSRKNSKKFYSSRKQSENCQKLDEINELVTTKTNLAKANIKFILATCNRWDVVFQILQFIHLLEFKYFIPIKDCLLKKIPNNWRLECFLIEYSSKEDEFQINWRNIIIDTNYFVKHFSNFNILIDKYYSLISENNYDPNATFEVKVIYTIENYELFINSNLNHLSKIFVQLWGYFTKFEAKNHRLRRTRYYFDISKEEKIRFLKKYEELENVYIFNVICCSGGDARNLLSLTYDYKKKLENYEFINPDFGFTMRNWLETVTFREVNFYNKYKAVIENDECFYGFVLSKYLSDEPVSSELIIMNMMTITLFRFDVDIIRLKMHLKAAVRTCIVYDLDFFLRSETEFIDISTTIERFISYICFVEEKYLRKLQLTGFDKFDLTTLQVTKLFLDIEKWKQYRRNQISIAFSLFSENPDVFIKFVDFYVSHLVPMFPKTPFLEDKIQFLNQFYENYVLNEHFNILNYYAEQLENIKCIDLTPLKLSILLPTFSLESIMQYQCTPEVNREFFNVALKKITSRRILEYRWHQMGKYDYAYDRVVDIFVSYISIYTENMKLENCIDDFFKIHVDSDENYHSYTTKLLYISTATYTEQNLFLNHVWDYFQMESLDFIKLETYMKYLSHNHRAIFLRSFMRFEEKITYEIVRLINPMKHLYSFLSEDLKNILKRVLLVDDLNDIILEKSIKLRKEFSENYISWIINDDGRFYNFVSKIFDKWTKEHCCSIHYMIQRIGQSYTSVADRILKVIELFVISYKTMHPDVIIADEFGMECNGNEIDSDWIVSSLIENIIDQLSFEDQEEDLINTLELISDDKNSGESGTIPKEKSLTANCNKIESDTENEEIEILTSNIVDITENPESMKVLLKKKIIKAHVLQCIKDENSPCHIYYKKRIHSSQAGEISEKAAVQELCREVFLNLHYDYQYNAGNEAERCHLNKSNLLDQTAAQDVLYEDIFPNLNFHDPYKLSDGTKRFYEMLKNPKGSSTYGTSNSETSSTEQNSATGNNIEDVTSVAGALLPSGSNKLFNMPKEVSKNLENFLNIHAATLSEYIEKRMGDFFKTGIKHQDDKLFNQEASGEIFFRKISLQTMEYLKLYEDEEEVKEEEEVEEEYFV